MIRTYSMPHTPQEWLPEGARGVLWADLLVGDDNILITDDEGSYGLYQVMLPEMVEFHFFVDPEKRSRSTEIAKSMIAWGEVHLPQHAIMVKTKTTSRHVVLLARRCGFSQIDIIGGLTYLIRFKS